MKKPAFPACETCSNRHLSVFCKLKEDELMHLSACKGCNYFAKGQLLYFAGSRPTGVHCISSGKVKIYRMTEDGKTQITKLAGCGDIVGYEAILGHTAYPTFAEVIEKAQICYIPKSHFLQLLRDNTAFSFSLIERLSLELMDVERRFSSLAAKPVRERIAEALISLKKFYDSRKDTSGVITLSREELASYTGTVAETASRILADFRHDRLISLGKRSISILNEAKLTEIATRYENN